MTQKLPCPYDSGENFSWGDLPKLFLTTLISFPAKATSEIPYNFKVYNFPMQKPFPSQHLLVQNQQWKHQNDVAGILVFSL